MALFSDEPRFRAGTLVPGMDVHLHVKVTTLQSHRNTHGNPHGSGLVSPTLSHLPSQPYVPYPPPPATHKQDPKVEAHLGPGAYFTAANENLRGGWVKKSFSKRQPMSPGVGGADRSHHFQAGVMLSSGLGTSGSPRARPSPGPGHYIGQPSSFSSSPPSLLQRQKEFSSSGRPSSAGSVSGASRRGSLMSAGSPRMAANSTILRDGVLFQNGGSAERDGGGIGPGYYAPMSSSFQTKSFNARVNKKSPGVSPKALPSPRGVGTGSSASRRDFLSPPPKGTSSPDFGYGFESY